MRLIWQSAPRDVLCRGQATTGGAGGVPPLPGVLAFTEDLVRVRGVSTLQHLPAPEGKCSQVKLMVKASL